MRIIYEPWPWYVAGPIIAIVYFLMKYFGKSFGISSVLRDQCALLGAGKKVEFFNFDWKKNSWNMVFVLGAILGGFIVVQFFSNPNPVAISQETKNALDEIGIHDYNIPSLQPNSIFGIENFLNVKILIYLLVAGLFVGFGTRYAGGCTSGHAISGLANLQLPSLIAVIGFFIGGLVMVWFILPHLIPSLLS